MSKDSSANYYQNNKERLVKDVKVFIKKKNEKSNNMVVNDKKVKQKMKNKSLVSIEKYIIK